ncbi:HotDog domain-containing protein [Ochromonadaceae sp. CCMP2298]|nr:HotDog domain-containing protein [Ochromonadaceae sp. CCMP2298]
MLARSFQRLRPARVRAAVSQKNYSVDNWISEDEPSSNGKRMNFGKELLQDKDKIRFGWSKEVVKQCLPFTSDLINSRRSYDNLAVGYSLQQPPLVDDEHPMGRRRVDDSWLELIIPFADQESLRENMCRADRKTVRYGRLFELLDALAGDVAYRHCGGRKGNLTIVTASVDGFCNFSSIDVLHNIKMQGYITYVGSSSMEVAIDIVQMCDDSRHEQKVLAETKFIMVARDGEKALKVPGLLLANEQAKEIFDLGAERACTRRVRAKQSLAVSPPRPEEVNLIHNLMLSPKQQVAMGVASVAGVGGVGGVRGLEGKAKSMASTVFKSSQLMHLQNRNVHGKIFGGYIMKKSFELAYVAACLFCREEYIHFLFVDDIQFVKPMNVGSVAEFSATVTYSREGHVVVRVVAMVIDTFTGQRSKTNVLNLIFRSRKDPTTEIVSAYGGTIPQVLPSTYDEVMLYLEGKRSLDQLLYNRCEV